jgi:GNAT superfamily N-acetyltransferase
MLPDGLRLSHEADPPPEFRAGLGQAIQAFLAASVPGGDTRFGLRLLDAADALAGGLSGRMYWGWLFVEALWVREDWRGRGAGAALLAAAERHAAASGCHAVWLDTFQSRDFYEKQGYTLFGALADYPPGQTRSFLQKRLRAP